MFEIPQELKEYFLGPDPPPPVARQEVDLGGLPALVWGKPATKVYLYIHGEDGNREDAEDFARVAETKGIQTLSVDLPGCGKRRDEKKRRDVWSGMETVTLAADYAFAHWKRVGLLAGSIGAYYCLQAFPERKFERAILQSPILDLEWLVRKIFNWFDTDVKELKSKGDLPTPVETLTPEYWQYVQEHPLTKWSSPTWVLHAGKDQLQSTELVVSCCRRFQWTVAVCLTSDHNFRGEADKKPLEIWYEDHI